MTATHPILRIRAPIVGRGEQVYEIVSNRVTIGRAETCDVILLEQAASRTHAELRGSAEGYLLVDLGSDNGVWVDGQRVTERALRDGESFRIGETTLQLVLHPHAQQTILEEGVRSPVVGGREPGHPYARDPRPPARVPPAAASPNPGVSSQQPMPAATPPAASAMATQQPMPVAAPPAGPAMAPQPMPVAAPPAGPPIAPQQAMSPAMPPAAPAMAPQQAMSPAVSPAPAMHVPPSMQSPAPMGVPATNSGPHARPSSSGHPREHRPPPASAPSFIDLGPVGQGRRAPSEPYILGQASPPRGQGANTFYGELANVPTDGSTFHGELANVSDQDERPEPRRRGPMWGLLAMTIAMLVVIGAGVAWALGVRLQDALDLLP